MVEASNAREGLSAKAIDKPELILLDLGLPDRDGLELVEALRQKLEADPPQPRMLTNEPGVGYRLLGA